MNYKATVSFEGVTLSFNVADGDHGKQWAETRAIAHFFYRRPDLRKFLAAGLTISFRELAEDAKAQGLMITLI